MADAFDDGDVFGDDDLDGTLLEAADQVEGANGSVQEDQSQTSTASASSPPPSDVLACLREHFGHADFKPLQWDIISSIVHDGRDQCVVMATGYGKSLCYQFPPVYSRRTALIVSPLIALMLAASKAKTWSSIKAMRGDTMRAVRLE